MREPAADWRPDDVVLLAVKYQDTARVVAELRAATDLELRVLTLQNGVASGEQVGLSSDQVACGMVWVPAVHLEPGVVWLHGVPTPGVIGLGYSAFAAFVREHLDLKESWLGELVRLVEADLALIKRAVGTGLITLTDAVKAPGVAEGEEEDGLVRAGWGEVWGPGKRSSQRRRTDLSMANAATVDTARERARLLLATPVSDDAPDLADDLLGPWVEPTSLGHGLPPPEARAACAAERTTPARPELTCGRRPGGAPDPGVDLALGLCTRDPRLLAARPPAGPAAGRRHRPNAGAGAGGRQQRAGPAPGRAAGGPG